MDQRAAPPLSRREQKKRETHERILNTAERLFTASGFDAVTVDELSAAAGISKPTFFNYFASKHAAVSALEERTDHAIVDNIRDLLHSGTAFEKQLSALFESAAEHHGANTQLARLQVEQPLVRFGSAANPRTTQRNRVLREAMDKIIAMGRERGEVCATTPPIMQQHVAYGVFHQTLIDTLACAEHELMGRLQGAAKYVAHALAPRA